MTFLLAETSYVRGSMIACTCMVPTLSKICHIMVLNHGVHFLRTMVQKIPSLAPGFRKNIAVVAKGDSQDYCFEGVRTQDHGFESVGTTQVQVIMVPLIIYFIHEYSQQLTYTLCQLILTSLQDHVQKL